MLQDGQHLMMGKVQEKGHEQKEETVDDLLHKLAKKGKKVKLLDESTSIKELKKRDSIADDDGFDRDGDNIDVQNVDDDINEEIEEGKPAPSSTVKKKMKKIKESRNEDDDKGGLSAQKLLEQ